MTVWVQLSNAVHCHIDRIVDDLPVVEFTDQGYLIPPLLKQIRAAAVAMPELTEAAKQVSRQLDALGYVVVKNLVGPNADEDWGLLERAACFNVLLGSPFHMMESIKLWELLGVRFDTDSFRAHGTGDNPRHVDGVNTTYPPGYLVLLCLRPDPAGGGANLLSTVQSVVEKLSDSEIAELSEPSFEDGKFDGIVGEVAGITAVRGPERRESEPWRVRVSGKMLSVMEPGRPHDLIARVVDILGEGKRRIPLAAGEALYVNQTYWVHGREPLGANQESVSPYRRRHFMQTFIRATPVNESIP